MQASVAGGAPCVTALVVTSVWTVHLLRLLALVCFILHAAACLA